MRRRRRTSSRQPQSRPPQPAPTRVPAATLILLGLIIGLGGALYYTWIVDPVIYVDASPARFSDQYKTEYILLVSQSYVADENGERARQRLAALDDANVTQTVVALLERFIRENRPSAEINSLAVLAQHLGADSASVALFAPTPIQSESPTVTHTPTPESVPTATTTRPATTTPLPALTPSPTTLPSPTSQPTYRLLNQERVCEEEPAPRIEVITLDALLNQLPGIEVAVQWGGGTDRFFTGFKPEQGAGYGDFTMMPDVSYTISLVDGSPEISGLRPELCEDTGLPGGWRLTFQNLIVRES